MDTQQVYKHTIDSSSLASHNCINYLIYSITIFLSAFLLFAVQPIIGKFLLPWFGGSPSVWTMCMLFFMVLLLAGYFYVHILVTKLKILQQTIIHSGVIFISMMLIIYLFFTWNSPITPNQTWFNHVSTNPISSVFAILTVGIGLPYFLLSTTSSLLQAWFARLKSTKHPYQLYAISNAGSLLAIAIYPIIVEPIFTIQTQGIIWSCGFICLTIMLFICTRQILQVKNAEFKEQIDSSSLEFQRGASAASKRSLWGINEHCKQGRNKAENQNAKSIKSILIWIGLSAIPSTMLVATTNQISYGIASIPFLWLLPLALYLIAFIICFANGLRFIKQTYLYAWIFILFFLKAIDIWFDTPLFSITDQIVTYSLALFSCTMLCLIELYRQKPNQQHLTIFYLAISIGGAIGAFFVGIIAPLIFTQYWEFPIGLVLTLFIAFYVLRNTKNIYYKPIKIKTIYAILIFILFPLFLLLTISKSPDSVTILVLLPAIISLLLAASSSLKKWLAACAIFVIATFTVIKANHLFWQHSSETIAQVRNFYGVLEVKKYLTAPWQQKGNNTILMENRFSGNGSNRPKGYITNNLNQHATHNHTTININPLYIYVLRHGEIAHGAQLIYSTKTSFHGLAPMNQSIYEAMQYSPTTYYAKNSGLGLAILNHPKRLNKQPLRIGVLGLGVGSIAAYCQPKDYFRFYEINPAVITIANTYFTYLKHIVNSHAAVDIVLGDARLSMEKELKDHNAIPFDILVIDAFRGDAIPTHLLTIEAFKIYLAHLAPDGIIAVDISNRYLDISPVLKQAAKLLDLKMALIKNNGDNKYYTTNSVWVLLTNNEKFLDSQAIKSKTTTSVKIKNIQPWTDKYSSMFQILK